MLLRMIVWFREGVGGQLPSGKGLSRHVLPGGQCYFPWMLISDEKDIYKVYLQEGDK